MNIKLLKLHIQNFKCFENHIIQFKETSIIVGENNAGKSTIIEALRILGLACTRLSTIKIYNNKPDWVETNAAIKGVKISTNDIDVELSHVFHRYSDPPALIEGIFSSGIEISIYINSEKELFVYMQKYGKTIDSRTKAIDAGLPSIGVLPQIVPLIENEEHVSEETTKKNRFSKRTSRNFRTILYDNRKTGIFSRFCELVMETWSGIKVESIRQEDKTLYLDLRDRDFVTEIYYMGHGIQMWLQTMWFITNTPVSTILVLDEPDVYMHADLQRKLIRLLKGKYIQVIVATHSIEIISEVLPNEILIVDRKKPWSMFADSYPELQTIVNRMGSIHNISLTRLLNNRKYLFVEGQEFPILKILFDISFPDSKYSLDYITNTVTGGWGSWRTQISNVQRFKKDMPKLKAYFIYDRDYHSEAEISKRIDDSKKQSVYLHIWNKKEIENYLLVPIAIARFVCDNSDVQDVDGVEKYIKNEIDKICESIKMDVWDKFEDEWCREQQGVHSSTIRKNNQPQFFENWNDDEKRLSMVPGKEVFETLSDSCQNKYSVSFSDKQIASALYPEEISAEMKDVLKVLV